MTDRNGPLWTIDQLGAQTARALAVDYDGPPNDRIRDVPDRRTIRYYTTLGLVDRPPQMRGRTALYGRRNLMQLVAIKRLQAQGLSLAEIQRQLVGLTDAALAHLARLPSGPDDSSPDAVPHASMSGRSAGAFWTATPAPVAGTGREIPAQDPGLPTPATPRRSVGAGPDDRAMDDALPLQGVRLSDEVTLLLATTCPIDAEDIRAIRMAAAPLLKLLRRRRLCRQRPGRGDR
jgi:hypothetical protein